MNPPPFSITTTHNTIFPPDSICTDCHRDAIAFFDALDDEFCAAFCMLHLLAFLINFSLDNDLMD